MNSVAIADRTINVPFHGSSLYIVNHNGEPYTPMKPIVEGMGITWQSQLEKIKNRFSKGVTEIVIPSAGGSQSMTCLALRKLNGWLQTISPNKVKPEIRANVIRYQEECDDVLYEYWTNGEVKNPRKTKKSLPGKITPDQQEAIKQLVMTRGKALPKERQAKGMITLWSSLKSHFGCSYKDIGEEQFTEALSLAARVPLQGEFIGKQELLPAPALNIDYPMEWFDKWRWALGDTQINVPWNYPAKRLNPNGDNPNPLGELLGELERAGFKIDAARFQLSALQHHVDMFRQKIDRINQLTH